MSMSAQEWFRSYNRKRRVQARTEIEIDQDRMAQTRTHRRDWTSCGGSVDQAISKETGGCWLSTESGNRGDAAVMASYEFIPEVAEEDARVAKNDRLRQFKDVDDL